MTLHIINDIFSYRGSSTQIIEQNIMDNSAKPSWFTLAVGIWFPAIVVIIELSTSLSGTSYFDPIPTFLHFVLVAGVPLTNFVIWQQLERKSGLSRPMLLSWLSGLSIAVALYYTIVYLPILPIAIIAIIFLLGLLVFAPLSSLVGAWSLRKLLVKHPEMPTLPRFQVLKSIAFIFCLLILLDVPKSATYIGMQLAASNNIQTQQRGISLISIVGDLDPLIETSYGRAPYNTGALSLLIRNNLLHEAKNVTHTKALLFKVSGKSYLDYPVPIESTNDFGFRFWDTNRASDNVGQVLPYLQLVSSNLDGDVNSELGFTYVEWTMEVKNESVRQQEARFQVQLPNNAAVSRVTLWVNDEPQEAAFAKTSLVKQAYTSVVSRQLDPLLVTSSGPQRLMLQAFPIPPNGGTMKFKIGITSEMDIYSPQETGARLPQLIQRNFTIEPALNHSLWLESKTSFSLQDNQAKPLNDGTYRLSEPVEFSLIEETQLKINATRDSSNTASTYTSFNNLQISQQLQQVSNNLNEKFVVVIDASVTMSEHLSSISNAFEEVPEGQALSVILADEHNTSIDFTAWKASNIEQVKGLIEAADTKRGFDNSPALIEALKQLEGISNAHLLWVHSTQPVVFSATENMLVQATARLNSLPNIAIYSIDASENKAFSSFNWLSLARQLNQTNMVEQELGRFFNDILSPQRHWEMVRMAQTAETTELNQYSHVARLWALDEIKRLIVNKDYNQAGTLGEQFQLVTPLTGAVVLETQDQYDENDLEQADKEIVPEVSAPSLVYLFVFGAVVLLCLGQRKKALNKRP